MTAEDLNTNLRSNPDKNGWFSLNFDPDVVENTYDNIFTKTELQAEEIEGGTNVYLKAKGVEVGKAKAQGYIVVDTAYIKGTENNRKLISLHMQPSMRLNVYVVHICLNLLMIQQPTVCQLKLIVIMISLMLKALMVLGGLS